MVKKPIILTFDKNKFDNNLMNDETVDLLYFLGLELPSKYNNKSLRELKEALKKSEKELTKLKRKLKYVADFDHFDGKSIASPTKKEPKKITLDNIAEHNILEHYKYNLNLLRELKE